MNWPWGKRSDDYDYIREEPHLRTNPVVSTPSLIWHVAVWPSPSEDAHNVKVAASLSDDRQDNARGVALDLSMQKRNAFVDKCNDLLKKMQEKGRAGRERELFYRTKTLEQLANDQSIGFVLWWQNEPLAPADEKHGKGQRLPHENAICVRVRSELHTGFVTFTFLLDVAEEHEARLPAPSLGGQLSKRQTILAADQYIHDVCEARKTGLQSGENSVPEETAMRLKSYADLLYEGLWDEFAKHFALHETPFPGEIFASFRGFAMTVDRSSGDDAEYKPRPKFDARNGEPNITVKQYWPFIVRTVRHAEQREYVACGMNGWRAIFFSSLGAPSEFSSGDEELPPDTAILDERQGGLATDLHLRYTLLVKTKHHKQQLGRLIDRINALGTYRHFALKDLKHVRQASVDIRLRGQELDSITNDWHRLRRPHFDTPLDAKDSDQMLRDCERVESRLIALMASLDRIGEDSVGGLSFRISRSLYYVESFTTRVGDLRVERIQDWVPYDEFARRRLYSIFDFISRTGTRLSALRQRVSATMEAVQTSAILLQTKATSEGIKSTDSLALVGVFIAAFSLFAQTNLDETETFGLVATEIRERLGMKWIGEKDFNALLAILASFGIAVALFPIFKGFGAMLGRWRTGSWFRRMADSFATMIVVVVFAVLNTLLSADNHALIAGLLAHMPFGLPEWVKPEAISISAAIAAAAGFVVLYAATIGRMRGLKRREYVYTLASDGPEKSSFSPRRWRRWMRQRRAGPGQD